MNDLMISDDLEIRYGDFVLGHADEQSLRHLLIASPGDYKQNPIVGCGVRKAKNGVISRFLHRNIKVQLKADGFMVKKLEIMNGGVDVRGYYEG